MGAKLSDTMYLVLKNAAEFGYQGEMACASRRTEDALLRRGLITYDYDRRTFASGEYPVLTVAGWAVIGERPADPGRLSFEDAWKEAHTKTAETCICPRMEPPAKYGHHVVCPLRATDTNSKENNDVTIKEGPLTERQWAVLRGVSCGRRYTLIARHLEVSVSTVKAEVTAIVAKLGTETIAQAVARSATANAYRTVADLLDKHSREHPQADGIAEDHVNHVLMQLAEMYRGRAERLLPQ